MIADALLLSVVALGHLALVVLAINTTHGSGIRLRWLDLATIAIVGVLGLATLALGRQVAGRPWADWPAPLRAYAVACLGIALIGLPVATLVRQLRRPPLGIKGRSRAIDLAARHGAATLIGPGRRAWWLRVPGNESLRLCVRAWEVPRPGLPPALDGLRILHLTDLHLAPCYDRRYFEHVFDEASRRAADLVLFTGDLIDDDDALDWIEPLFARLRGRLGQFAILGNHDIHHDQRRARSGLERAGFAVIDGQWTRLEVEGSRLVLGGTSAPWGPALDPRAMPAGDWRIVLSHTPDLFYRAAGWGIDLVLAGHNHGGQCRLPVVGPVLMPSRYSRRFDRGFFQAGSTLMYVGQGIGSKSPIRIGCPPEVSRIALRVPRPADQPHRRSSNATATTRRGLAPIGAGIAPRANPWQGTQPHEPLDPDRSA